MPQVINTNIPSLTSQRNLNSSQNDVATALQRLSSGLRINSARDDAAGLAISERFTAQIRGLNQAARNASDGISLAQTAEGDLAEITNNLQRIRELAVQSANATNSASDRQALQSEVNQLVAEIERVAGQSNFNGVNLLDGSFSSQVFQVGANAGETITVDDIVDARTSSLGVDSLEANGSVFGAAIAGATNGLNAETDLTITTADGGTTSAIAYSANDSALTVATAINSAAASVGVTATASNSATLSGLSADGTVSFSLNGASISAAVTASDLGNLVNAINGQQGTTGVVATFADPNDRSSITLSNSDGANIGIATFAIDTAGNQTATFTGSDSTAITLTEAGADTGIATGTVSLVSTQGAISLTNSDAEAFDVTASAADTVSAVNISTVSGAEAALATIDGALTQVNGGRADLGAIQNRFESVVTSLQTSSENLSAARSRIQDADFAAETAALTRGQILQQAGISVLAQANAQPQNVLALLQ